MAKGGLVFVTTEIYPFTGGGIGRFVYNVLKSMPAEDLRRTTILLTHGRISRAAFEVMFPEVQLQQLAEMEMQPEDRQWASSPEDPWFTTSVQILILLKKIASATPIDYVEFPDWSGLGFATIQEKHLSGFLRDAVIAVRVHSTEAILVLEESRLLRPSDLRRYDLERKCYRDCDVVIAHLNPVAERTRVAFGFSEEEWAPRLHVVPPPVDINGLIPKERSIRPGPNTSIVFSSKFQEFKRPQVFVQGVVHFLETNTAYQGDVVLACAGLQSGYARRILGHVPRHLLKRFKLLEGARTKTRDELIASSIAAFPTSFESYCLAAYEAAALGAVVVLNERNPAFGQETPWIDRENCLKFDGSALGLSRALTGCFALPTGLAAVVPAGGAQTWNVSRHRESKAWHPLGREPLVSVIVVNQNEGTLLGDTLDSLLAQDYSNRELIVVDDGSSDGVSPILMESLKSGGEKRIAAHSLPVSVGRAAARNWAVERAAGSYVMHLNSGDLVPGGQLRTAVNCLENNTPFDIVVPQAAWFSDADRLSADNLRIETFVGEAVVSGPVINYFAASGWVCRSSTAKAIPYRPETGYLDGWAWMLDAVNAGSRVVASPGIGIFTRDKAQQDAGTPLHEHGLLHHLVVAHAPAALPGFPVAALARLCQTQGGLHGIHGMPEWYRHMTANSYEGEVEFMAEFFGYTWLGRLIRKNARVSYVLEKLVRAVGRMR